MTVSVRGAVRSQSTRKLLRGRNTFLASAVGQLNRYQCGRRNLDPHSCNFASNRFSARSRLLSNDRTATQLDRKSTRLNSSHSQISYAVFCLKKKKRSHHLNIRPYTCWSTKSSVSTRPRTTPSL